MQMIYYAQAFFFFWFCWILMQDFVEMAEEQDPQLFQLIQNNKAYFLRLLLEGGAG